MNGGGEDFIEAPWAFLTFFLLMGLAMLGGGGFCADGGAQIDGGYG